MNNKFNITYFYLNIKIYNMVDTDDLKNPLVIAFGMTLVVYIFYHLRNKRDNNVKIQYKYCILAGLITWFISGKILQTDFTAFENININNYDPGADVTEKVVQQGGLMDEPIIAHMADF